MASILYLSKQDYLLTSSYDNNYIINVLSIKENKLIQSLTGHRGYVSSLVSINDETFASRCFSKIKIWRIKHDNLIECIQTLKVEESENSEGLLINLIGNRYLVSHSFGNKFEIWNLNSYEKIATIEEDDKISCLVVTKDNKIITCTNDKKINVWKMNF